MPSEVSTVRSVDSEWRSIGGRAEARASRGWEQQAATAEIVRVNSSSPTDLQRAFAEIAATAADPSGGR